MENDSSNTLKSTQSVSPVNSTSSRQKYRYVNGRRHHDDDQVSYVLPNDDDGVCVFKRDDVNEADETYRIRSDPSAALDLTIHLSVVIYKTAQNNAILNHTLAIFMLHSINP